MKVLFFRFLKLIPVFLLSFTLSCGGGGGGGGSPLPSNPIVFIVVKPETVTLAKGGSLELSASTEMSEEMSFPESLLLGLPMMKT